MNLKPLTPINAGSWGAELRITCCSCDACEKYADAAALGWRFDPDGEAFKAYYCKRCAEAC
jgi:hypothetical protein